MDGFDERPTLAAWVREYEDIEREYVNGLEASGMAAFAPRGARVRRNAELRAALRERGARFLHDGSSISSGFLSSACAACVGDCGSRTFYINLKCPRNCYFCFNPNQADYKQHCKHDTPWREELDEFARTQQVTHVALTGGEPLLCKDEALAFLERAHGLAPGAHLRLYTSGMGLDEAFCEAAVARGLSEIRFSVKLDEGERSVQRTLADIALARRFPLDVMVEMPVAPDELERTRRLLVQLDGLGVRGINLLEFCYPLRNWREFERRGYRLKNPPFSVLYDYGYSGGLAIDGSEEACLELLLFAMDEGLRLGVHYCSLDNKNRDQMLQKNRAVRLDARIYELHGDCLYHTAKVFDADVPLARAYLRSLGAACEEDPSDGSLLFHPRRVREVASLGTVPAISYNVVEQGEAGARLRELKLALWE